MADFFMIFTDFYKLKGLNKFNSLNMHAFFKKVCVLLLFLCGAVSFAENYYWQGGASGEWAAAGNWYTVITNADSSTSTQTAASAPGTGDTAIFSVQVSQNTDVSAFTITDSSVTSGAITSEAGITFFGSLTASGDITIDSGDLTVGENLTVTGSTTVTDGNLTVEGSYTGNKTSDAAADISVSGDFVVENTGETNIRGVVTANSINIKKNRTSLLGGTTSVTTTGTQNYGGEVLVNEGITISASTVTFGGKFVSHTTGSCKSVTIEGNAEFNDEAGVSLGSSNGDKLDSLSVSGTSTVSNNIYTKGAQTYGGPVTLSADSITFSTGGALTLSGGLTGTGSGSGTVYLCGESATSYDITVGGAVSGVNDIYFNGNAAISSGAAVTADGAVSFAGTADVDAAVSAGGAIEFEGTADLSAAVTSTGASVSFDAATTVNSTGSVSANTDIAFGGTANVNGAVTAVNDIVFTGEATVGAEVKSTDGNITFNDTATLGCKNVSASENITFESSAILSENLTFTATTVTFNGKLVSHSKDSRKNATIKGNAVFNGVVGAQEPAVNNGKISALTVSGTSTVSNNIYTTGAQTYGGPVTLSADRITFSTGGTLTLTGGLTGTGSGSGTVTLCDSAATYSNTITVGGAVSGVNDIYFNGNAAISSGATVTADGAVSFAGTADLSAAVTSGGAGVSFDAAATVNSTGSVSANTDIAFGGTATVNGTVTAVNDIDFTGEATVGAEVKASNDITFNGTANVNSAVTAINALVFNGDTTITSAVKGNTVTFNGSLILNNGSVTSTKDQNYNGTTQFGWWQTLTSTEGSIYFGKESSVTKINCIGSNSGLGLMVTTSSAGNVYFYGGFSGSVSLQICGNAEIYGDNTFTSYTEQSAGFETAVNFYGENKFTDFTPAASNYAQTFNFKGASTFTKFTATANAAQSFNFDGANTFETFTATAKSAQNFNFSGKNSFSSLTATATANQNFNFTDSNSFTSLDLTASGAPLTLQFSGGSTQTFGTSSSAGISSKGKSETNCVMLTSDSTDLWNAVFLSKPDSSDFTYTVIKYSASVDSSGASNELNLIPASSTVQDYSPANPTTVSWFTHKFYWLGGSDTNWTTVGNWAYDESGSNSSAIYPSYTDGLSEVTVLKGNSTSSSPFILTLAEAITVKSIQIESGAEVDFAGKSVEAETILIEENSTADFAGAVVAASGGITNKGTLKLAGMESISGTKTNGTDSTVQYYGSAITALSWGSEYEKLEFIEGAAGSVSEAMNVAKTLVIKNDSGNALELSGNGSFTGEVTLTDAGNITFGGANSFNDALNVVSADNISFSEGNAFAGKVNVTSAENLSFTQANTFEKTVTVTEAQDISFDAANTFNDVIKIVSAGDINFAGENSFAGALEIASAENVILNANTNGVELAGNVECETLDAKCAVTVGGSVTTSGTLTAGTETVGQYYESTVNFADKAVLTDNSTANKVYISGAATGEGDITINADAVFASTLDTKGALTVGGILQADGSVGSTTPPTDINVTGNATFDDTLDASGALQFSADATFTSAVGSNTAPASITLGTDTTNTATFESTLDLTDALTAAGTLTVNGALGTTKQPASITVGVDAIFGEAASVKAAGPIDIKSNATFGSTLDTKGVLTVGGTLQADGSVGSTTPPTDITVTGNATFASTLDASGALTVGGTLQADGAVGSTTPPTDINVTGDATFASTLDASGVLLFSADETFTGAVGSNTAPETITLGTDAANTATFESTLDLTGALTAAGTLTVNGALGSSNAPASITVGADAIFGENASVNVAGPIEVTKNATFGSTLDATDSLTVGGTLQATGAVGNTTPPTDITVTGNATFDSTLDASGALTVGGNAAFCSDVGTGGVIVYGTTDTIAQIQSINVTGQTYFNSTQAQTVQTAGEQTYAQKITVDSVLSLIADDSSGETDEVITLNGISEGTNTASSVSVKSAIVNLYAADYSTYGSQTFSCSKGVRLLSSSDSGGTWQCKNSDAEITLDETELFLDFDSCSMKLQSPLKAKNVYFYSGALGLSGVTLSATDFVAFGASYSAVDGRFSSSNTRFAYYGADSIEYKKLSDFNASLSCSDEAQIEVEGNFYANGLDLASFTLTIPDNSDSNPEFNSTDAVTQKQWGLPYAVAFNSKISSLTVSGGILAAGSDDGVSGLSAQGCTDGSSNTGVQFELPQITKAYSVYDDVVYVEFNIPLENSKGEISTNLALYTNGELSKGGAWYSSSAFYFEGAYSDADCTTPVSSDTDIQSFYLKGIETWNTDATGKLSYGSAAKSNEDSTDRSGTHKNVTTDLSFLEGLFTAADGHTMCSTYNDTTAYTATEDHASPVLIAAYTGQELHTTGTSSSQSTHDAHNFIELRYSEAVDIAGLKNDGADENVRADSSLGEISGSGTQSTDSKGLTIAGLAEISDGILLSSSKDAASPHSLYRNFATLSGQEESAQTHRLRISIAGYVSGTVSFTDSKNPSCSGTYHNWIGCIKSATTPQGTVKVLANSAITDLASSSDGTALQNQIDSLGSENHALKEVTINSYSDGTQTDVSKEGSLYGEWDTMPPVITPFIRSGDEWQTWANSTEEKWEEFEIIGTSDSSSDSTLKYVEIHFLDNDKTQAAKWSDYWRTKSGWNEDGSLPETRGGARPFTSSSLTTGGIRLSSLKDANSSFTYTTGGSEENFDSSTDISQITYGGLFKSRSDPSTVTDGLYIRLPLEDLSLAIRTTFELFYNPEDSYITDLAGNLLSSSYSEKTGFVSIDITAPSVLLTLAPIGEKQIYAVFSKQLAAEIKAGDKTTSTYFKDLDASDLNEVLANIAETFIIVKEGSDSGTTAEEIAIQKCEYVSSSDDYTALLFTLEDSITLSNVETLWLRNTGNSEEVQDLSGLTVKNTIIRDSLGNYMTADSGHAISDFAVNALDVLYAYANAKDGDDWSEEGLYGQGIAPASSDYAVHDFSATQGNYGKLLEGRDITVQVQVTGGTDSSGSAIVPENRTFVMIPSKKAQISSSSVSDKINALINADWRLWLPSALKAVASQANTNTLDSPSDPVTADDDKGFLWNYTLPQSTYGFASGDEIQFLFKLVDSDGNDITIDNDADDFGGATQPTDRVPLYAVKMPEAKIRAGDFSFVDLWSFGIKSIKQQRGGVTILNNVINVNVREQTVVEVTTKEEGSLNVFVMTLDGNIVKRLNHGRVSAGTHYYRWNGTNNSGTPVARGLYFVRVVGPGIDETRKVMCVKEK